MFTEVLPLAKSELVAYVLVRGLLFRSRQQKKALANRATMSSELRRNL